MKIVIYTILLCFGISFITSCSNEQKSNSEKEISEPQINEVKRFGLTEDERKDIWSEMIKAQDRASSEASEEYPTDNDNPIFWNGSNFNQSKWESNFEKNEELNDELRTKYEQEVADSYSIEMAILDSIATEGQKEMWPFPDH